MKIVSVLGITRIIVLVVGSLVAFIGFPAAFNCHSFAVYRRKFKDITGMRTAPVMEMVPEERFVKYHGRHVDTKGAGWAVEFVMSSLFAMFITPPILFSFVNFGLHLGEPEAGSFMQEYVSSIVSAVWAFFSSLFILDAAIVPDLLKKEDILEDAHKLGKDKDLWEDYLDELDGYDVSDRFKQIAADNPKLSKTGMGEKMYKAFTSDLMRPHREESNFGLKIAAGVFCLIYMGVLIVQALLILRNKVRSSKRKSVEVLPIEPPRLSEDSIPPEEEEPATPTAATGKKSIKPETTPSTFSWSYGSAK